MKVHKRVPPVRGDVIAKLRSFVARESNFEDEDFIEDHTDLLGEGILDSVILISLILFCEETFSLNINAEDWSEDNLRTLDSMARFIIGNME